MEVSILMEDPFEGIFYTRGSYKSAKPPCYFDATGDRLASLKIPLEGKCKNKKDAETGEVKNTVIVQHDDFLIYPGTYVHTIGTRIPSLAINELPFKQATPRSRYPAPVARPA